MSGFRLEGVSADQSVSQFCDRGGELRDLLVLAHEAGEEWSAIASLGVERDLGEGA